MDTDWLPPEDESPFWTRIRNGRHEVAITPPEGVVVTSYQSKAIERLTAENERLEAEYREVCSNLQGLIAEAGLGEGQGGEKIDKIVCDAYRKQQADNKRLRDLCGRAAKGLQTVSDHWFYGGFAELTAELRTAAKGANDG